MCSPSPTCNGGCFTPNRPAARIVADSTSRSAATYAAANNACRGLGAYLPTVTEFQDLVKSGWVADATPVNLWLSEQTDVATGTTAGWGYMIGKWSGVGDGTKWLVNVLSSNLSGGSSASYRCVWRESLEASFRSCGPTQVQTWDEATKAYKCVDIVAGNSNGNGNPSGNHTTDGWSGDWDNVARTAATYQAAADLCSQKGARLPTATELYRVSSAVISSDFRLFSAAETLWTMNPVPGAVATRVSLNTSTGAATATAETATLLFRCYWPPTPESDAFTGRSCHGDTRTLADPCFTTGHLRADRYDRAKLQHASAAWECEFLGGRLPTEEEYMQLIHAGLPNGTNAKVWAADRTYANNLTSGVNGEGYTTLFWTGAGTTSYSFPSTTAAANQVYTYGATVPSTLLGFRCVFSDVLKR